MVKVFVFLFPARPFISATPKTIALKLRKTIYLKFVPVDNCLIQIG